jgi:hypothetical protein
MEMTCFLFTPAIRPCYSDEAISVLRSDIVDCRIE